jgi:hypothetical protein
MRLNELASVIAAVATVVVLVGGYVQFVLRRALHPCVEFDVDFVLLRNEVTRKTGDIVLTVKNVGPGAGYVTNVQGRVRYSLDGEVEVGADGVEPAFRHSVRPQREPGSGPPRVLGQNGFLFATNWSDAFVQPGVTQTYRKPLAVPGEAVLIHVWGAFEYRLPVGRPGRLLARLFIHHRRTPAQLDYTVRRTFSVDSERGQVTEVG